MHEKNSSIYSWASIYIYTHKRYNSKPVVICQEIGVFKHEKDLGINS